MSDVKRETQGKSNMCGNIARNDLRHDLPEWICLIKNISNEADSKHSGDKSGYKA